MPINKSTIIRQEGVDLLVSRDQVLDCYTIQLLPVGLIPPIGDSEHQFCARLSSGTVLKAQSPTKDFDRCLGVWGKYNGSSHIRVYCCLFLIIWGEIVIKT